MLKERAWIFVNGDLTNPKGIQAMIQPGDLLVAADGGLRHLRVLGLQPAAVLGDLDSIAPGEVERLQEAGVIIEKHPVAKDETDLELALTWVLSQGIRYIRIAAAQGDRFDHTLGNLFLLMLPELEDCDVRLEDGQDEVFLIRSRAMIGGKPGDRVSLLPLGAPAVGVTTHDLQFTLHGETLWPERTRGISNVMLKSTAVVEIAGGVLICIHTRLSKPRNPN
jgi:thiamine pyrophosphokinase